MTFDTLAPTYDDDFTHTAIGRYLRGRVQARLMRYFRAGDSVLEMGCGTGEDALFLAQNGIHVTATDASAEMLKVARSKTADYPQIRLKQLDLKTLDSTFTGGFDGAFANFGVLNCLDDWRPLAIWLAGRVQPGGVIGFGIMAPYCVWEVIWHGLHGDFRTALRRTKSHTPFKTQDMIESITYPTVRRMTQAFAPEFARIHVEALGLTLPPSDAFGIVESRPRLLRFLTAIDNYAVRFPVLAQLADHYWIEFRRIDH